MEGIFEEKRWTSKATKLLLSLYMAKLKDFQDPKQKKKAVWEGIVAKMEENGVVDQTPEKLDRKFRNLKKTYNTIKMKVSSTGHASTWEFFDEMETILGNELNASKACRTLNTFAAEEENKEQLLSWGNFQAIHFDNSVEDPISSSASSSSQDSSIPAAIKRRKRKAGIQKERKTTEAMSSRTEQLQKIRLALEESNKLQAERNQLMREFLSKIPPTSIYSAFNA